MQPTRAPSRHRFAFCSFLCLALAYLFGCDSRDTADTRDIIDVAGVAGTGNAGRVEGVVQLADRGVQAETRLLRIASGRSELVRTRPTDSVGVFVYDSVESGRYMVEAWQDGELAGRSSEFVVTSTTSQIVIVLVKPVLVHLDLRALGNVDSVYLDYPGNPVFKTDSLWTLRDVAMDSMGYSKTLFTKVIDISGNASWLSWNLVNRDGQLVLAGLVQGKSVSVRSIDSGTYFPNRHTKALWTFDTITSTGLIRDQSPYHNDLAVPFLNFLTPSPHGRAIQLALLPFTPVVRVVGDTLSASLQWWHSDYQTIRLRIKLDEPITRSYQLFGTYNGLIVAAFPDGHLQIQTHSEADWGIDWYSYLSATGVVESGAWTELTITRDAKQQSFALWKDGVPVPLFAQNGYAAKFVKTTSDTFTFAGGRWDDSRGPFEIDEMEISDTLTLGGAQYALPTRLQTFGSVGGQITSFTFDNASAADSTLRADSSATVSIGKDRSLFVKLNETSSIAGQGIAFSVFSVDLALSTTLQQKYAIYEAYASLESKFAKGQAPKAGVDYSATPCSFAILTNTALEPIITTLVSKWAANPTSNHGLVIQPIDKTLPDRAFKIQHDKNAQSPYLYIYTH